MSVAIVAMLAGALGAHGFAGGAPLRTRVARARTPHTVVVRMEAPDWIGAAAHSEACKDPPTVLNAEQIMAILPHRYPFLLVDKVVEFEPGKRCVAMKKVTANEEFFIGHFPNRPIMPGVLQVEAMAQVGGLVALQPPISNAGGGKGDFFFAGVDGIKWRRPVVPGDTLTMEVRAGARHAVPSRRAAAPRRTARARLRARRGRAPRGRRWS